MFTRTILKSFLYVPRDEVEDESGLIESLTLTPRYAEDEEQKVELFDDSSETWLGVPRYFLKGQRITDDLRATVPAPFKFKGILRAEQEAVVSDFTEKVENGKTGFIFQAPPAFGKTVCLIKMMEILGQRTLVIVPRSNLIRQWMERLRQFSNLKPVELGWMEGGKGVWKDKKVVVGLVHSLVLDREGAAFRKSFGCVVFDEVDRSVPPQTFAPAVGMFPAKYRIGASAVLKRQDGMEKIFEYHMGECFLQGKGQNRMRPKVLVKFYEQSSGFVYSGSAKMNRRGMLLSRLASNKVRNEMLVKYIEALYGSGRQVLVLSERKEQLAALMGGLSGNGIAKKEIGYYVRSMFGKALSDAERRRSAIDCKILLGTYQMIDLGTDIPSLSALVYATPRSDVEQSKGRIERILEGKKEPVIVDIVDTKYGDALGWSRKRMAHYQEKGLEIHKIK